MRHFHTEPSQSYTSTTEREIIRIMTCSSYCAHTDPIFKDILTIGELVVHQIRIAMYKINRTRYNAVHSQ